jgi:probable metal-binding protein
MQIENIEIHGHEVLEMMIETGHTYCDENLEKAIDLKFGKEARFYICSGGDMTAAELIEALWAKGKFSGTTEAYVFDPSDRCDH